MRRAASAGSPKDKTRSVAADGGVAKTVTLTVGPARKLAHNTWLQTAKTSTATTRHGTAAGGALFIAQISRRVKSNRPTATSSTP